MAEVHLRGFPISVKPDIFSRVEFTYLLVETISFLFSLYVCLWMEGGKVDVACGSMDKFTKISQLYVGPLMLAG